MRPQFGTTLFKLNVCVGFELLLPLSIYFELSIVIILFELRCIWTMCTLYVSMWTIIAEPLRSWLYVEKVWDPSRFHRLSGLYGLKYAMTTVSMVVFIDYPDIFDRIAWFHRNKRYFVAYDKLFLEQSLRTHFCQFRFPRVRPIVL
jgi:hypothetical protein